MTKFAKRQREIAARWPSLGLARLTAAVWLLAAALSLSAHAADDLAASPLDVLLDLEVSGASKFALRVSESPSSATVIGAEEIRALGYRTLADVLQSVRGLLVSTDRTYAYLGVRGFATAGDYNTRILLLIDGNRVNDTVYDQAFLSTDFPLDLALVERVEFIPGQGSAVHGGNALFGTINVVTRRPGTEVLNQAAVTVGHGWMRKLQATTSRSFDGGGRLLLSGATRRLSGIDVRYPGLMSVDGSDTSRRTDHERGDQFYLKYESGNWVASLLYGDRVKGLSAYPGTVFGDPGSQYRDMHTLADATMTRPIDAANLWKLRLFTGRYAFRGDFVMDYPPVTVNQDGADSRWWGVESQLFSQQFAAHRLVAGVELQSSPHRDQTNIDVSPAATYLDDRRSSTRRSLFAEDQWEWSPTFAMTMGLRWDRITSESKFTQFSPRLAMVWRPTDKVVLKFIHGTGFRPSNAFEAFYAMEGTVGYKGNPALRNERVRGNELVLELRPSPATRFTASAYANQASDLLVQRLDPQDNKLVFENVGSMRTQGLELELERVWTQGAHLRASYSLQHARDTSGQGLGDRNAEHLGKVALILPLGHELTLGSQTVLVSRRADVPGYGVTNLTLTRAFTPLRADVSLGLYDAFNRRPVDPGSDSVLQPVAPQDGRTWQLRINVKL